MFTRRRFCQVPSTTTVFRPAFPLFPLNIKRDLGRVIPFYMHTLPLFFSFSSLLANSICSSGKMVKQSRLSPASSEDFISEVQRHPSPLSPYPLAGVVCDPNRDVSVKILCSNYLSTFICDKSSVIKMTDRIEWLRSSCLPAVQSICRRIRSGFEALLCATRTS